MNTVFRQSVRILILALHILLAIVSVGSAVMWVRSFRVHESFSSRERGVKVMLWGGRVIIGIDHIYGNDGKPSALGQGANGWQHHVEPAKRPAVMFRNQWILPSVNTTRTNLSSGRVMEIR